MQLNLEKNQMSKTIFEKWYEISLAVKNSNSLQISNYFLSLNAKTKLYLGKTKDGQLLYIEFEPYALANVELPALKGIELTIVEEKRIDPTKKYIKIKNNTSNEELFMAFSSSLCDALSKSNDYYSAYIAMNKVIKDYREFFSNKNSSLSPQAEQGLCAELLELKKLIINKGEKTVFSWMGPDKNKRDFLFNKSALEIKSSLGQIDPSIEISNENQLDQSYPLSLDSLFLKVYILEKVTNGFNIISIANEILELLSSLECKSSFIANLMKMKIDINSYIPQCHFSLQYCKQYLVDNMFPKITRNILPCGVFDVNYRIHLDVIKDFEITDEVMYGRLQ